MDQHRLWSGRVFGRSSGRRAWSASLGVAAMAMMVLPAGGAGAGSTSSGQVLTPPPVPTSGGYLGAFVDPSKRVRHNPIGSPNIRQLAELGPFEAAIGRPLGLMKVYQDWKRLIVSNSTLDAISDTGAIPIIDWNCGGKAATDADIAAGDDDTWITQYAKQLKAYTRPVFLMWYREPNLIGSTTWKDCAGPGATQADITAYEAGYVAAWQHIWHIFKSTVGATNVAFMWAPGSGGNLSRSVLENLYPGPTYVDWIGIDGYSRPNVKPANPSFTGLFDSSRPQGPPTYQTLTLPFFGVKPMMISETGAVDCAACGPPKAPVVRNQAPYLQSAITALDSGDFPQIHGLAYFDATDPGCPCQFALSSAGLSEFRMLAQNSYFDPTF